MLPIVDRHVLKQIATPLIAAFSIGLLMLLAERMVRLLDTTLGKKNSFAVVFEMLAYLVPNYLGTAIPAALFLGLLFGFSRMAANSETDAFMAAGVGLNRLARPVIVVSILLSAASFFVFGWAQPYTRYAYRSVVFEVQNVEFFYLAEEGVFMQSNNRTFILDTLNRSTNAFDHVFVYDQSAGKDGKGSETVTATKGTLVDVAGQPRPVLHLEHGHRFIFDTQPDYNSPATIHPQASEFEVADTPLGRLSKDAFRPRGEDERELTLPELFAQWKTPPQGTTVNSMVAEIHHRIVSSINPLILPFLALPFTIGSRRSRRAYRFATALVLVLVYHEVVERGSVMAGDGKASPWVAMWAPFALLVLFTAWRYYAACFTVNRDVIDAAIDNAGDALSNIRDHLLRRAGLGAQP
ncbi:LptF/LptG family permease [Aestuariivirga sp.]|uniref:LptF/LptG family permease n=1 Tax=Aestuariivirga sp. TaxID=2650926 RepID=UPI0039E5E00F